MPVHQLEQRRVVVEVNARLVAARVECPQLERLAPLRLPPEQTRANTLLDDLTDGLPSRGCDLPHLGKQVLIDGDRGTHSIRACQRCSKMHPLPVDQ